MSFDTDPREEQDAEMYAAFAAKDKRIAELEMQLLAQAEQKPVAWFEKSANFNDVWFLAYKQNPLAETKPLYAAPPVSRLSIPQIRAIAVCDGGGYQDDETANWKFSDAALMKFARALLQQKGGAS